MTGEVLPFPVPSPSISPEAGRAVAEQLLSADVGKRDPALLHESEAVLAICQILDQRMQEAPASVARDAEWAYQEIEQLPIVPGSFLFDEREYYLGELALLAGCACRFLTRRAEARTWFDRAEPWFLLTSNSNGDLARVAYQRLAVKIEERDFSEIVSSTKPLIEFFSRTGSREFEIKSRILLGLALQETDRLLEARDVFKKASVEAQSIGSELVLCSAYVNLIQIHCMLGEADEALALTREATPLLTRLNNRVALAKMQWGIASLLRTKKRYGEAVSALRLAQREFMTIELKADVAAIQLVIADLLLELGQEAQAEWEIRAALPVIDELKMVPEGVAALSLLRESVRRRKIDRQALRDLHGYFDEIQG